MTGLQSQEEDIADVEKGRKKERNRDHISGHS
jgi:hypothetical protein